MRRASIEFRKVPTAIPLPITKFGGQPVWLSEPEWPVSRATGNPMRFIAQIALEPPFFGTLSSDMAYLFMTDEDEYVDGTWEPDSGENAVVLQRRTHVPHMGTPGPTLYRMVPREGQDRLVPETCEFAVDLIDSEDPDLISESELYELDAAKQDEYLAALQGSKLGGTPGFLQAYEFPGPGEWKLLLQLDSTNVPFFINFGDSGIGYAFIRPDGTEARFLWQGA